MALTLTNRAKHMLIVDLNNGEAVYLLPGQTSNQIDAGQINSNEKISKMVRVNALSIYEAANGGAEAEAKEQMKAAGVGKTRLPKA